MNDDTANDLADAVAKAGRNVAAKWPGVVCSDDVSQELWLRLLGTPGSVEKILGMDFSTRVVALEKMGHQIAAGEREDYAAFTGNVYYGTNDVRRILDQETAPSETLPVNTWDAELNDMPAWENGERSPRASAIDTPGSETSIEQADLSVGMSTLRATNPDYHFIIVAYYWQGESLNSTQRKVLTRAVDKLTNLMNGKHRKDKADYFSERQ